MMRFSAPTEVALLPHSYLAGWAGWLQDLLVFTSIYSIQQCFRSRRNEESRFENLHHMNWQGVFLNFNLGRLPRYISMPVAGRQAINPLDTI